MSVEFDSKLLDQIYEAAVLPDGWKNVLNSLSDKFGAKGGVLFTSSLDNFRWLGAGESEQTFADWVDQGWAPKNDRVPRLLRMNYPGFVTDLDIYSADEIANSPMYNDFLIPRGFVAVAGTAIQGASGDTLIFSIEGMPSHDAARKAIPFLDPLRGHLARSAMLASQFHLERARAATTALQMVGVPAAFITRLGRLRAINRLFEPLIGDTVLDTPNGIRLSDANADKRLRALLEAARSGFAHGLSFPIQMPTNKALAVLHALPVAGQARDVFMDGGTILLITGVGPANPPGTEILKALFDLTPAEARLARILAKGAAPEEAADKLNVQISTVRSQLKSLFPKLGVNRQAQLVALLASLALPS